MTDSEIAAQVDVLIRARVFYGIRYWAAGALGSLRDPRAVGSLIDALHTRKDPSIATVLGNLGNARAVEPLIVELELLQQPMTADETNKIWGSRRSRDIYFYCVAHGRSKLGDPRALPLLEWVRDHEQEPVLKGKRIGYKAARAIARFHARMESSTQAEREHQ